MVESTTRFPLISSTNSSHSINGSDWSLSYPEDGGMVGHHGGLRDQTLFVSLVVMGIVVPAIFVFMFVMICLKHKRTLQSRRSTMLLRHVPDVPMDDIPLSMRTNLENGRL